MDHLDRAQVGRKPKAIRQHLDNRRPSQTFEAECDGFSYTATISRFADGRLGEILGAALDLIAQDGACQA